MSSVKRLLFDGVSIGNNLLNVNKNSRKFFKSVSVIFYCDMLNVGLIISAFWKVSLMVVVFIFSGQRGDTICCMFRIVEKMGKMQWRETVRTTP